MKKKIKNNKIIMNLILKKVRMILIIMLKMILRIKMKKLRKIFLKIMIKKINLNKKMKNKRVQDVF